MQMNQSANLENGVPKARTERRPGHCWADNEILDDYGPKIGAFGLAVYMVLCRRADNRTGQCRISNRDVAKRLAISPSTVRKSLRILSRMGLIEILMPENKQGHAPASYVVLEVEKRAYYAPRQVDGRHPEVGAGHSLLGAVRPPNKEERLKDLKTNTTSSTALSDEEFLAAEAVYVAYPRHVGKRDALVAIEKAAGLLTSWKPRFDSKLKALSFLKERAIAFAMSPAGRRGQMTPHPATWFKRGSYEDDPEEWEHLNDHELKIAANQREANVGVFRPC